MQTDDYYTAHGHGETLTTIRQKHHSCYLAEKTSCDGYPSKTQKEHAFGTTDDNIIWNCSDGTKGGSVCNKSCGANHLLTDELQKTTDGFRVRIFSRDFTNFQVYLFWC